mmetsp:Transcript_16753/g.36444  ORF Transcript_16753/g.36444 Transcript_16753/m.36444 type:complete len:600 (-) Transcript_16753:35-1834(-)
MSEGGEGGEVLTLQFGSSSNYVGSHFWNLQDEYLGFDLLGGDSERHDVDTRVGQSKMERNLRPEVLYRVTETSATPRAVVVDFKSNRMEALGHTSSLFDSSPQAVLNLDDDALAAHSQSVWQGAVEVRREPELYKNDFMTFLDGGLSAGNAKQAQGQEEEDLFLKHQIKDSQVHSWGDFLKARLHPKSINMLHQFGNPEFDHFTCGADVLSENGGKQLEDIMESIRFFLEECGRLQGVHVMVDVDSGYGSIAQQVLQEFKDDVKCRSILGLGIVGPEEENYAMKMGQDKYLRRKRTRNVNQAMGMCAFSELCSLYVPMPLYSICEQRSSAYFSGFDARSLFHTTALAAVALDSISMPYRRSAPTHGPNSACLMPELLARLAPQDDMRVGSASLGLPFPHPTIDPDGLQLLLENSAAVHESRNALFPIELSTAFPDRVQTSPKDATFGMSLVVNGLENASTSVGRFETILGNYCKRTRTLLSPCALYTVTSLPMPISLGFPDIFNKTILGEKGQVSVKSVQDDQPPVPPISVPVISLLENTTKLEKDIVQSYNCIKKQPMASKLEYMCGEGALSEEDFEIMTETLDSMQQSYSKGQYYTN